MTNRDRFLAQFEATKPSTPAVQNNVQEYSNNRDRFLAQFNAAQPRQEQNKTAPAVSVSAENGFANVNTGPFGSAEYAKKQLATINAQLAAMRDAKDYSAEAVAQEKQLLQRKDELEQVAKVGLYDEDISFGDRLQYMAQGIGYGYNATPDVLADTAVQAAKDAWNNRNNTVYHAAKDSLEDVTNKINAIEYRMRNGFATQAEINSLAQLKALQAQHQAVVDKYTTPLDVNTDSMQKMQRAMQYQQKMTEGLGTGKEFLWNTASSIVDNASMIPLAMMPGGQGAVLAAMGAKSAAMKAVEVGEKGGSAGEALLRGLSSGAIEAATEKLPLDNLVDILKGKAGRSIIKNALVQAFGEGAEETVSYLANLMIDKAAQDPDAKFSIHELIMSFLGGALSGGVMGGGATLVSNIANPKGKQDAADTDAEKVEDKPAETATEAPAQTTQEATAETAQEAPARTEERIALEKQVQEQVGIDTRTEVEKEAEKQAQRLANVQQLADSGLATEEQVQQEQQTAQQKVQEAANRDKNNEYQRIDKESGAVRQWAIDNGKAKDVARIEKFVTKRGLVAKFYHGDKGHGGFYADGVVYINVDNPKIMLKTAIHETFHGLKTNNKEEYDLLMQAAKAAAKVDKNLDYAGKAAIAAYANTQDEVVRRTVYNEDGTIRNDVLEEEMLAKMIEELIDDPEAFIDRMNGDRTIVQKVVDFVKNLAEDLAIEFTDNERTKMRKAVKDAEKALERYLQGEAEARKPYIEAETNAEGEVLTIVDKETGEERYNLWQFREGGGKEKLEANLKKKKFGAEDVKAAVSIMEKMAQMMEQFGETYGNVLDWNNTQVVYNGKGKAVFSAMVKNGDYPINIDLSTICKKRVALQKVLNKLVKQNLIKDVSLSPENIATINKILKENGYETQCPACFVESKRYNIEKWANDFVDKWNNAMAKAGFTPVGGFDFSNGTETDTYDTAMQLDEDLSTAKGMLANIGQPKLDADGNVVKNKKGNVVVYKPNTEQKIVKLLIDNPQLRKTFTAQDLIGTEGIRKIKTQHPEIYSLILTQWGVATPKIVQTTIPYNNEVAMYRGIANRSKYIGGVRMFSFSDFTIDQVFDYVQIVADLYTQKAMMHTYTKEITFAKLFGMTGIKINLSYIPAIDESAGRENAGLDADGDLIYSEWGVQPEDAEALMADSRYSPNLTPVMIGVSDNHIWKLLDTDGIRYIIPYHKSSLNPVVAKMTDIHWYTDYSDFQTTRHADGKSLTKEEGKGFDFYKTLEKVKDARKAADAYLEWCDKNGYLPKFEKFRDHPNYYKLLVDFNLYDSITGEYVAQNPVTMTFPEEFKDIVGAELEKQDVLNKELSQKDDRVFGEIVDAIKKDGTKFNVDADNTKIPPSYEGKTLDEILAMLISEHGAIEQGENPAREIDVPTKSMDKKVVSKFARTVAEAEVTPDDFAKNDLLDMTATGKLSHEVLTDNTALKYAESLIRNKGYEEALDEWNALGKTHKRVTKRDIALGQMLYNGAVNSGDTELAQKLVCDLCVQATRAGQTVQAFRLLKKMTPNGQLYMLQKSLDQINRELLERYKGDFKDIKIPKELANKLLQAKNKEEQNAAVEEIEQYIADNIPATIADKFNAWRYLAMLGNPRTHIRNMVGNAMFSPFKQGKDIIGAILEDKFAKEQKTKAVVSKKKDAALFRYAETDFLANKAAIKGEAKYDIKHGIKAKQKVFKNKHLENARKKNTEWLEKEDMIFLKRHYVRALAGAMKANGITAKTADSLVNSATMERLKAYATKEAQKATYRDVNFFSKAVQNMKKGADKIPGINIAVGGILPFARTPANIIARGIEYSPVNIARGAVNLATGGIDFTSAETVIASVKQAFKGVNSGKYTTAEALDQLSSGLTGTLICALGYILASLGIAKGKEDDDSKEADMEKLYGMQDYSIDFGEYTYTVDWAAPAAMPFFVGVELFNAFSDKEESSGIVSALLKIADPVFEMSMLDGINNAIEATFYTEANPVVAATTASALNYAGQAVPTLAGQFARTGNRYRTQTYIDKNKKVAPTLQRFIQQQQAKVPVLNNQLTSYYDQWGRKQDNGNVVERAFTNFASPGYISKDRSTAVDDEVMRIYNKTKDTDVLPSFAGKKFSLNGEYKNLTAKEYATFAQTRGQIAYKVVADLLNNPHYKALDTAEQAEVIAKAYTYAQAKAKTKVSDYQLSKQEKLIDSNPVYGVLGTTALKDEADQKGDGNGSVTQGEARAYLDSKKFTKQQKAILFSCMCPSAKTNPYE